MDKNDTSRPRLSDEQRTAALEGIRLSDRLVVVDSAKALSSDPASGGALMALLERETREENRKGILYALSWHSSLNTWDLMLQILSDEREAPAVRGQAAEGITYLFRSQDPKSLAFKEAIEVLSAAARDPSPEVRYCAAHAMGASGHLPLIPVLHGMLRDHAKVPGWVGTVADEASRAIKWLEMG